jgi:hypothetical protein
MAKGKFSKENMYNWVVSASDRKKLYELDAQASPIMKEKIRLLKKASQEYKRAKSARTPAKPRICRFAPNCCACIAL